jgi:hypothetical protein
MNPIPWGTDGKYQARIRRCSKAATATYWGYEFDETLVIVVDEYYPYFSSHITIRLLALSSREC